MAQEGSGKIARIFENKSKAGKRYWRLHMEDGSKYSTFDEHVAAQVDEGAIISFLYEEREPFPVIVGLGEDAPVGEPSPRREVRSGQGRDRMIVRQACLKAAASVLPRSEDPGIEVMKLAERFERWVAEAA